MPSDKPKRTEKSVLAEVKDYLAYTGWRVVRIHQSLGSERGICDLIAVKGIVTLWIECKSDTGKLSEVQEQFRDSIQDRGHVFIVARKYEDVQTAIDRIKIGFMDRSGKITATLRPDKNMRFYLDGE